uniref:ZP domain-containing protein n=2 Tax=Acrobeloides nanus TaxID=290746 RepID=A0A914CE62_9BILA
MTLSFDMDNGLIGVPDIACNTDTIEMRFKTKKKFTGKIYVQGHYNNPECRVDYGQTAMDGHPIGGIKLNHGACDMDRQRMIAPEGMQFSTVIVISFHPLFITKTDRAFHIKCLYRETVQTVNSQLEVSSLPTESIAHDMPMPICTYTIRKDEIDGPILKYARVGDQVVHRWECDNPSYGLLVHSCYVEDGQGEKQMVIDENGCHTDRMVLGDPTYVEALNIAYRESYVFKFADRVGIRFQCEIRLCVKEAGGCNGITPPLCFEEVKGDWVMGDNSTIHTVAKRNARARAPTNNTIAADLISQYVYVLDADSESSNGIRLDKLIGSLDEASVDALSRICLSSSTFTAVLTIFVLIFVLATSLVLCVYYKYLRVKTLPMDQKRRISSSALVFT